MVTEEALMQERDWNSRGNSFEPNTLTPALHVSMTSKVRHLYQVLHLTPRSTLEAEGRAAVLERQWNA